MKLHKLLAAFVALALIGGCDFSRPDDVPHEIPEGEKPPHGYSADDDGHVYQTNFDLRQRGYFGVADGMDLDLEAPAISNHSTVAEFGIVNDRYVEDHHQRRRLRFGEGRVLLDPLEIDLLLIEQEFVNDTDDPGLWIAFPFGDLRLNIPIRLGLGWWGGRLHHRTVDGEVLLLANAGGMYMNWEFFGGDRLEDYLLFRLGLGGGIRTHGLDEGDAAPFIAPELGARAAWAIGDRGLTHLGLNARYQPAFDIPTGDFWATASASAYIEQIIVAVSDNPVSLFIEPEVRWDRLDFAAETRLDYRLFAGARFSMSVPPRPAE